MSLVQVMEIAESLLQLDPLRSYPTRGAEQVARSVRAAGYAVEHRGNAWESEAVPRDNASVALTLRVGREEVGKMELFLEEGRARLAEDELRIARWATRLYAKGLAYTGRMTKEPGRANGEPIEKMLKRSPLTPREQQLVIELASGASTRDIAGAMGLTIQTVNTYLKRIYAKVGVHSRVALLARYVPKR